MLGILFVCNCYGQGASNKGTDFWLGYGKHTSVGQMVVYLTSDVSTTATVSIDNLGFSQTVDVPANGVVSVDIPTNAHLANDGLSLNGIHVTSIKPIIVYAHIYANSVSGATLVLPVNALGKDYYSINYKQISNSNGAVGWFFVVAVEDSTKIEITPSADTEQWNANTTHTVLLNKGQIYNVLGKFTDSGKNSSGVDLTGSRIKSVSTANGTCKKIAVFSGSSKISINCLNYVLNSNPGSADNLFQQTYPTSSWGKTFITVPEKERNFVIYRVLKSDVSAIVKVNGNVVPAANFTNGFYYDYASQQVDEITADKPIQVVQYAVTQRITINCGNDASDVGDPEMIYLNPLEQTLTKITMYSTNNFKILKHFINVVIRNDGVASFTLDGVNVSSQFAPVPNNSSYSYAQLSVAEGTHNLNSLVGFNAIAYGFGAAESYGYAAGANLTAFGIDPVKDGSDSISVSSGCVGIHYDLNLKLPYEPLDIQLDKDDGTGLKYITVNKIAQSTKDGATTYYYSLIPDITYTKDSTYTYKVRTTKPSADDCGTGDEFTFDFIINPKPVANFTAPPQSCFADSVSFKNVVVDNNIPLNEYMWDFNGEATSTLENPKFKFSTPGKKTIKFSVKSQDGCWSDVISKDIEIMQLPVANFTISSNQCLNNETQFADASTVANQTITNWTWDFGDTASASNSSILQNPSHTYNKVGSFTVKLIVGTNIGCKDTLLKQVIINPLPEVDFDTPDICLNDASAQFINKSTVSDNSSLTYLWDFGDSNSTVANNTSTLKDPTHHYTQAKNYIVKLTVTSANSCVTTLSKTFTVNGSTPKADFSVSNPNQLCSDQIVSFKDAASVDFGEITKIEWIYDDALPNIETDNDPNLRSDTAKIYTHHYPTFYSPAQRLVLVKMKAYSGISCANTMQKSITLKAIPKADFILPDGCLPNGQATFTNNSTFDSSTNGLTYQWDFGDDQDNTSTDKDPIHQYKKAKDYTITLTVTALNGCSATVSKVFKVSAALPNTNFEVINDGFCSNSKFLFKDDAAIAFGQITKIEWQFDAINHPNDPAFMLIDNAPAARGSNQKTYEFTYPKFSSPATKDFKVTMFATSATGCVNQFSKIITLKAVPDVEFSAIPSVCEEFEPFMLTEAKEVSGFAGKGTYSGDGVDASGLFSPKIAGAGKHTIMYNFIGDNGCSDFKTQDITVNPTPSVNAGDDKNILIGGQIRLDATANGDNLTYKWTPSTGLDKDDVLNPIASPTKDTKYNLLVTSKDGCINMDDVFVKVLLLPEIPNTFTPNGDGVNDTWDIKYLSSYPSMTVQVFNRYGNLVYNSKSYTTPWDGKFNNKDLPEGLYYYIITAKQGELKYSGSVLIVR
ncbi:PKD domain-containing protein [Pedobacter sp. SD-b]|uniref:PKD domain-containing protein n=1 Tax=Pedobacter segetis TaxID=2793069 RepID=A0ABS1BGC4_9SPHI|nr:PKD domain-containing protein [Pedobacter segetis]